MCKIKSIINHIINYFTNMEQTLTIEYECNNYNEDFRIFDKDYFPNIYLIGDQNLYDANQKKIIYTFPAKLVNSFPSKHNTFDPDDPDKHPHISFGKYCMSCGCQHDDADHDPDCDMKYIFTELYKKQDRLQDNTLCKIKNTAGGLFYFAGKYSYVDNITINFYEMKIVDNVMVVTKYSEEKINPRPSYNSTSYNISVGRLDEMTYLICNKILDLESMSIVGDVPDFEDLTDSFGPYHNIKKYELYKLNELLLIWNMETNFMNIFNYKLLEPINKIEFNVARQMNIHMAKLTDDFYNVTFYNYTNQNTKSYILKLKNMDDNISDEMRCIICFRKTEKDKILVPCGHRQYCKKCIYKIKNCSLCNQEVKQIINVY